MLQELVGSSHISSVQYIFLPYNCTRTTSVLGLLQGFMTYSLVLKEGNIIFQKFLYRDRTVYFFQLTEKFYLCKIYAIDDKDFEKLTYHLPALVRIYLIQLTKARD